MEGNLRHAWENLAEMLRTLPASWPQELVFTNPPTSESPPYTPSLNHLRPNDGLCSLNSEDPKNVTFLSIQTFVAQKLDLYQHLKTPGSQAILSDFKNTADGLESIKRDHWEKARQAYHFGM
jgi:hypothetical protein